MADRFLTYWRRDIRKMREIITELSQFVNKLDINKPLKDGLTNELRKLFRILSKGKLHDPQRLRNSGHVPAQDKILDAVSEGNGKISTSQKNLFRE